MGSDGFVGREAFLRDLEPFFSGGLAHEIYFHKKVSIMNMANGLYIASMYLEDDSGAQIGIMIPKPVAYAAVENWISLLEWFNSLSESAKNESVMLFNPRSLEFAKQIKADTDLKGPSEDVDLEWEQSLKTGQGLKGESPSHGFLGKLKRLFQGGD